MTYSEIYLYSPLSPKTVCEGQNHALLLQFILSEIFHTKDSQKKDDPLDFVFNSPACFFPYDWSREVGALSKIEEHAALLSKAFPNLGDAIKGFSKSLQKALDHVTLSNQLNEDVSIDLLIEDLRSLYENLEPFIIACKENENLLLFLLKNADDIAELGANLTELLKKMFPEGLQAISHLLKQNFQMRGFHGLIPEIEQLVSSYAS